MDVDLAEIVKEAFDATATTFVDLVDNVTVLLAGEVGAVGGFQVLGKLAMHEPLGRGLIVGDLHGDIESLVDILRDSKYLDEMCRGTDAVMIFLGDYGDRGANSAEVYYAVLKIKQLFRKQVVLMRGNHEGPDDIPVYPYDLPAHFKTRFGEDWGEAHAKIRGIFPHLYNAVFIKERYLMIHGGLAPDMHSLDDLAYANETGDKTRFLEDMLWSDPDENAADVTPSPRGAGYLFSKKVTEEVLARFGAQVLIRGHESCDEGFRINHDGKVLTLFSRKGSPYFNARGAYLLVDFSRRVESAWDLVPYLHKF